MINCIFTFKVKIAPWVTCLLEAHKISICVTFIMFLFDLKCQCVQFVIFLTQVNSSSVSKHHSKA
jgi:uncharacterized membrane protein required for colicin V production